MIALFIKAYIKKSSQLFCIFEKSNSMNADVMIRPPRTLLEVFESLPEGTLAQLIQNKLIISPAPLDIHQVILNKINHSLFTYITQHKVGQMRIAPYDVYLDNKNVFQPDIIFIANENLHQIQENGLHGTPDMVIEILSPANKKYDLGEKKDIYEQYGVKEYWTVDPKTRSVQGFFLKNNQYAAPEITVGIIRCRLLNFDIKF